MVDKSTFDRIQATADRLRLVVSAAERPDDPYGDELMLPLDGQPARAPLPILTAEELRSASQAVSWLVKHTVPADSMGIIFGASGTFKSFLALDLAMHVAHGMQWMGKKTARGSILYVAAEGGAGLWKRIEAWHRVHARKWTDAEIMVCPVAADLLEDADLLAASMRAKAPESTPVLVVVDTLSQTFGGEENSATEVSAYLRNLGKNIRDAWRCAVLVVHHSGHVATERPRGSSALRANVDFMFGVHRDESEMLAKMSCAKQKDGDLFDEVTFAMSVVELNKDEDGDPVTALVARAVMDDDEKAELVIHEAKKGRSGRNATIVAMAQNGMREDDLRKAFVETVDGDADTRRQAYFRAKKWASNSGILDFADGYVLVLKKGGK